MVPSTRSFPGKNHFSPAGVLQPTNWSGAAEVLSVQVKVPAFEPWDVPATSLRQVLLIELLDDVQSPVSDPIWNSVCAHVVFLSRRRPAVNERQNDPSSATATTRRADCNRDGPPPLAAAHVRPRGHVLSLSAETATVPNHLSKAKEGQQPESLATRLP